MKKGLQAIPVLVIVVLLSSHHSFEQSEAEDFYRQWVDYRD